jgi:hypothetical protein
MAADNAQKKDTIDAEGLIDNLRLQVEILKSDNDDLRTERNLYKKLFEEEIILHYGHRSGRTRARTNPAYLGWRKMKIQKSDGN